MSEREAKLEAEIENLKSEIETLKAEAEDLAAECNGLREEVSDIERDLVRTESALKKYEGITDAADAVDAFCDIVQRPVGKFVYTVPQTAEANRAILALFDSINRNP